MQLTKIDSKSAKKHVEHDDDNESESDDDDESECENDDSDETEYDNDDSDDESKRKYENDDVDKVPTSQTYPAEKKCLKHDLIYYEITCPICAR